MRREHLLSAARLLQYVTACVLVVAPATQVSAQTRAGDANSSAPAQSTQSTQAGADADEEFDLNIQQRRISEKEFHAETAVEADGARGLRLGVGVVLRASDIEVLLSGVRGHVRFRGSLAPLLRLLEARRPAPTQTPPP